MNEPPKPGFWLIVNSVVVIGLCAGVTSVGLAGTIRVARMGLFGMFFLWIGPVTAYWQYRGTFHGHSRAAGWAAFPPMVVGCAAWAAVVFLVVGGIADILEWNAGYMVGVLGLGALGAHGQLTAWLNLAWSRRTEGATGRKPAQFSIRDLLAITTWIAVVAGMTRWMVIAAR